MRGSTAGRQFRYDEDAARGLRRRLGNEGRGSRASGSCASRHEASSSGNEGEISWRPVSGFGQRRTGSALSRLFRERSQRRQEGHRADRSRELAMITNERQYRITRKKARDFARAIEEYDAGSPGRADVHPKLAKAEREAMESQLMDLQDELEEYDKLKSAGNSTISIGSFEELADGLIKARIAGGPEPAGACGTSETQGAADPAVRGRTLRVSQLPAPVSGSARPRTPDGKRDSARVAVRAV